LNEGRYQADRFFEKARYLSPNNYKKYWAKSYRFAVSIFGLYLPEKIQSTLVRANRQMRYRKY